MSEFLLALGAFLAAHMIPAAPGMRARLVGRLGRSLYLSLYSLLSIALLVWVVLAARRAPFVPLWDPASWQWWVPLLVMPIALFLLVGGLAQANPLSVSLRKARSDWRPSGVAALTRHPVLWGFGLWASSHIPPNGHLVAVVLFGGMALLAFAGMELVDRKARKRMGGAWLAAAREAPAVPLANAASRRALRGELGRLALPALAALGLFAWFVLDGHARLIGLDPLAGL